MVLYGKGWTLHQHVTVMLDPTLGLLIPMKPEKDDVIHNGIDSVLRG